MEGKGLGKGGIHREMAPEKRKGKHQAWGPWVWRRRGRAEGRLGTHAPGPQSSPHNPCCTGQREEVKRGGKKSSHVDAHPQHPKHRRRGFQVIWLLIWCQAY